MERDFPIKISGAVLKWIAIITMFIDHIGASVLEVYLMNGHGTSTFTGFHDLPAETRVMLWNIDHVIRCVGRLAFPIFCFLLVEGFFFTKDVKKYARRLLIFGLISEIPGDLAIRGSFMTFQYQNVYWTLLIGLICIYLMDYFDKQGKPLPGLIAVLGCFGIAELAHVDYGMNGVLLIWFFYLGKKKSKYLQAGLGVLWSVLYGGIEMWGMLSMILVLLYNGERGRQPKYLFYVFYPAHLLILAIFGRYVLPVLM